VVIDGQANIPNLWCNVFKFGLQLHVPMDGVESLFHVAAGGKLIGFRSIVGRDRDWMNDVHFAAY
jgi:hypothetical protein